MKGFLTDRFLGCLFSISCPHRRKCDKGWRWPLTSITNFGLFSRCFFDLEDGKLMRLGVFDFCPPFEGEDGKWNSFLMRIMFHLLLINWLRNHRNWPSQGIEFLWQIPIFQSPRHTFSYPLLSVCMFVPRSLDPLLPSHLSLTLPKTTLYYTTKGLWWVGASIIFELSCLVLLCNLPLPKRSRTLELCWQLMGSPCPLVFSSISYQTISRAPQKNSLTYWMSPLRSQISCNVHGSCSKHCPKKNSVQTG